MALLLLIKEKSIIDNMAWIYVSMKIIFKN
jgi:hypothetical protein